MHIISRTGNIALIAPPTEVIGSANLPEYLNKLQNDNNCIVLGVNPTGTLVRFLPPVPAREHKPHPATTAQANRGVPDKGTITTYSFAGGKYVFDRNSTGIIEDVRRNGEPWFIIKTQIEHANWFHAVLDEIDRLQANCVTDKPVVQDEPKPGIPGNVITHRNAWRKALEIARDVAVTRSPVPEDDGPDDRAYWEHELAAFDRTFTRLWELIGHNE